MIFKFNFQSLLPIESIVATKKHVKNDSFNFKTVVYNYNNKV